MYKRRAKNTTLVYKLILSTFLKLNLSKMNALKTLFLLPLSILSFKMTAQMDDLLKNKDIIWIAETYNNFQTSESDDEMIGKNLNRVSLLKFLNLKEQPNLDEKFAFQNMLLIATGNKQITCYADEDCKIEHPNWYSGTDTIMQIDPTTYKEELKVVYSSIWAGSFSVFRARQIIYYNTKNAQFGLRTLAIAPMDKKWRNGKLVDVPYFWIKVTDLAKKRKLTDNNITWAAQMRLHKGFELNPDSIKILKKTSDFEPIRSLFQTFSKNPKIPFYKDFMLNEKWEMVERKRFLMAPDSMDLAESSKFPTFRPYDKNEPKLVPKQIKVEDIHRLKLIQNWYWNEEKKRLEIYLVAVAPLKDIKNGQGEFQYFEPLFYCRTDD